MFVLVTFTTDSHYLFLCFLLGFPSILSKLRPISSSDLRPK